MKREGQDKTPKINFEQSFLWYSERRISLIADLSLWQEKNSIWSFEVNFWKLISYDDIFDSKETSHKI